MYLSQLIIRNYRSIKTLDVRFQKGKNVIVGRNNAGKSNIVKAIDLVLGESSPTYEKSENITENDFFNGDTSKNILIFARLQRDDEESLNYEELYKCFGFYRLNTRKILDEVSTDTFSRNLASLFSIEQDPCKDKTYINPKLKNQNTFENEFDNKFEFGFIFYAFKNEDGKICKNLRFIYREKKSTLGWFMAFSASIRNELLQSAIIPSFRDPQNQLRISNWGWYGKMLKNVIDPNNAKLIQAFEQVKVASNEVFSKLQDKINHSKVKIAFPNTKISFQFNPDTRQDVHKSALVYVDDGFKTQLQDKGSGIQSAVIIGMFDFYTREIANSGNSLLAIEEPELYLHPHGRRVISNRLDDFLDKGKNQVIITTHSPEFINSAGENLSIIIVRKDEDGGTYAKNINFDNAKEKQILIKNQNTEMFFADTVILVEGGGDKYIVDAVAKKYGKEKNLGNNWLNDNNVSVIPVIGKNEFYKYVQKLEESSIKWYVVADFDFFCSGLSDFITKLKLDDIKNDHNSVNGKMPKNIDTRCENCCQKIKNNNHAKRLDDISEESLKNEICSFFEKLQIKNIFIQKGDLEDGFTDKAIELVSGLSGKEEKALHIATQPLDEHTDIGDLIVTDGIYNVLDKVAGDIVNLVHYEEERHEETPISSKPEPIEEEEDMEVPF